MSCDSFDRRRVWSGSSEPRGHSTEGVHTGGVFPKPFTLMHGVGICAFFAGLLWNSQRRHQEKLVEQERLKQSGDPKKTQ